MQTVVLLILILLLILFAAGWVFFRYTITRAGFPMPGKPRVTEDKPDLRAWAKYPDAHDEAVLWYEKQPMEEVQIMSEDGLKLYGEYLSCANPERIVVCVHGYRGTAKHDFAAQGKWLHEERCDVLFITHRGSGKSEGEYLTFGAREKNDVKQWAEFVTERKPGLPVYVYGISMGGTTALLSSVTGLPSSVKGIIADCGYTSMKEILAAQCRQAFHLPPGPLLPFLELFCITKADFRFSDADARQALMKNTIPVLFLHGASDHFVRPENSEENYLSCKAPKELLLIENAVHASSFYENRELYMSSVRRMFNGMIGARK